ncbi:MAG: hypothetical protein KKG94_01390 [Nanoarchaeota archaeon]|nr:hypothetical protein [Nanoarchaeota archaeon]
MDKMIIRTDKNEFGLIIPQKTGIIWEHQCDGLCCNQLQQEGVFIPLNEKYFKYEINDLGDTEYYYNEEDFPFKFEIITYKDLGVKSVIQMFMHEAYDWIIFKGWKNKKDYYTRQWDKFIGKKMLLIYANSD